MEDRSVARRHAAIGLELAAVYDGQRQVGKTTFQLFVR